MKLMKCVCIFRYGGPEVLAYEDAPCPHPGDGEVLVRVHAAGVNPVDWKIREGFLVEKIRHTLPLVLGWDVSGVVHSIGGNLKRLKVGDEVMSCPDVARDGAYAEYIVIKESEVALKPASVDHLHAAGLPMAGLTAWQALFEHGALAKGQRVLIQGAAGGVGSMALQLAKWKGAFVAGTASEGNHDFLRKLGIDQVVDYQRERFEDVVGPVDVVIDTQGGDVQERSWKVLKPGGILVSVVSPPSETLAAQFKARGVFFFARSDIGQLAELAKLVDSENLKVIVETTLPLSDATRGQELSQRGHARGKIVLRVV